LKDKFGFNVCGEGGEYESAVFDCPLFKSKLILVESKTVDLGNDYSPVSYLSLQKLELASKTEDEIEEGNKVLEMLRSKALGQIKANSDCLSSDNAESIEESHQIQGILPEDLKRHNTGDYCFISEKSAPNEDFDSFFSRVTNKLSNADLSLKNVVQVSLHIDMESFAQINSKYAKIFVHQPPVRVCVQPKGQVAGEISLSLFATSQVTDNLHV
jgi:diphthine-ammonia ligase